MQVYSRETRSKDIIGAVTRMANRDFHTVMNARNNNSNPYTAWDSRYVESLFYQPKELFEAVDFTNMSIINEPKSDALSFVKGEKYALSGVSCEGFEMHEKIYELIGVHDEYDGINIDSVIVKQVAGHQDKIFTLSKHDCECMGIEYENGLQLFPKNLSWRRVKDIIPFDKYDLSTTPTSDIDNTIRYVVFKLNGFKDYSDGYIVTPSGKLIKEERFERSLRVTSDEPFVYDKSSGKFGVGTIVRENTRLDTQIVYPKGLNYTHGNFISEDDTIYILVSLIKAIDDPTTVDGKTGIERHYLSGFNPNDHFKIAWDELGACTIEEYETEKAREEKARRERIEREEKEREKRIIEEENRAKERKKQLREDVNGIRACKIKTPDFNFLPWDADMTYLDGYITSLNTLDSSLNSLSRKLDNFYFKIKRH